MRGICVSVIVLVLGVSASTQRAAQPRTPWGDPDLQGTYTNTYENGTAFERHGAFLGPIHAPDNGWQPNLNRLRNILSAARAEERQSAR